MLLKNRLVILSVILSFIVPNVFAVEILSDVEYPKAPAYRVGISELPEKQYFQAKQEKKNKQIENVSKISDIENSNSADLTYADLSIKRLSREVAQELEFEEQDMLADLSLLWQGAAVQSDTINFALYKLANPDADKPDEKSVRNVLKTIASMSTLVGASMGSPLIAGSSLIGGNIFGIMSQDTKALNYKYTRVNDADMIILIRKVEDLQQKAVDLYYDYMSAKKQLEFANNLVEDRKRKFELAQKNNVSRELVVITDAYYRTALDKQRSAKSEFFSKRAALEQFVGNETFLQFESELAARERGENTQTVSQSKHQSPEEIKLQESEYQKTIENVKSYTENNYENAVNDFSENAKSSSVEENITDERDFLDVEPISVNKEDNQLESKKSNKFKFWKSKESSRDVKKAVSIEKENANSEKIKDVELKQNKVDFEKSNNVKLQPLDPITTQDYLKTVSDIENSLVDPDADTYDFSEAERRGKYMRDPMYDGIIGLASNVDNTSDKKRFSNRLKKSKSQQKEKTQKEKKEKVDPKSTKNLIFLHGEDKQTAKARFKFDINGKEVQQNDKGNQVDGFGKVEQVKNSEFGNLPPLDEIRVPDLTGSGYSIHSEYMY